MKKQPKPRRPTPEQVQLAREILHDIDQARIQAGNYGQPDVSQVLPGHLAWWRESPNQHWLIRVAHYTGSPVFHDAVVVRMLTADVIQVPISQLRFYTMPHSSQIEAAQERVLRRAGLLDS